MKIVGEELIDFKNTRKDPIGDIYIYKGRMVRIIHKPYQKYVEKLMQSPLIAKLIKEKLLVNTWISEDEYEEGGIVLEHERITPPQEAFQWTFGMMKDVAKLVLQINMICLEYGYELKDCHQANVMFDGTRPVWVDFGSIVKHDKEKREWIMKREFLQRYYYPLELWSRGYEKTIDALLKSAMNLEIKELKSIYYHIPLDIIDRITPCSFFKKDPLDEMQGYVEKLDQIKFQAKSQWGNYQDSYWGKSNERFDYEINWIKGIPDISTMIEVGANQGYFSYLAAKQLDLRKIIATDYDKKAVDIMYHRLKKEEALNITPLLLDFVWLPLEELKKYRCDLVVANALTHHLLLTQHMSMRKMAERFSVLADKYIIVEFMPYGVSRDRSKLPKWYSLESFLEILRTRFMILDVHKASKKRIIITGRNKEYCDICG